MVSGDQPLRCSLLEKIVHTNLHFALPEGEKVILSVAVDRVIFIGVKGGGKPAVQLGTGKYNRKMILIESHKEGDYYRCGDSGFIVCFQNNGGVPNTGLWESYTHSPTETPYIEFQARQDYLRSLRRLKK